MKPTIEKTYALLACTECGAEVSGSCNCHKAYKPVDLAAKAIAANPSKSNRAIADEIGVGHATVDRAESQLPHMRHLSAPARTAKPIRPNTNKPRSCLTHHATDASAFSCSRFSLTSCPISTSVHYVRHGKRSSYTARPTTRPC